MDRRMHGFLFNRQGGISRVANEIPIVRNFIENQRNITASFKLKEIPTDRGHEIRGSDMNGIVMEFLKTWRLPKVFATQTNEKQYINPNYKFKEEYSDVFIECECGAEFSRLYDNSDTELRNEHDHEDWCKDFMRQKARAELQAKRWDTIERLYWLGWKSEEIAPRINLTADAILSFLSRNGSSAEEFRNQYRKAAGNTYKHLVHNEKLSSETVEEIYGRHRGTLSNWYKKYGDPWVDEFKWESPKDMTSSWQGEYWND